MTLIEIVEADPKGERRITNSRNPDLAIGVHDFGDGKPVLAKFHQGQCVGMLSRQEIRNYLTDVQDDWRFSNQ